LHSFYELNNLLESNKHLWSNPPIYYLLTLEGILDSLRSLKNYEGMTHFIIQLKKLNNPSLNFNANVTCLVFLYELFPMLDKGDFFACSILMEKYNEDLLKKTQLLSLARNAELSLYVSLIYFGLKEYAKAQKALNKIILIGKNYSYLPLYRTIRLVNLMILYEKKDFDLIKYETRSLKRDMNVVGKEFKIERSILSFVNKQNLPLSGIKRKAIWENIRQDFEQMHHDVFEQQIIRLFDFSAWIESKIRKVPLAEVMADRE
jgi:tetratricopeptide (TPR) repeat protein